MSRRIHSEFGTLGERIHATARHASTDQASGQGTEDDAAAAADAQDSAIPETPTPEALDLAQAVEPLPDALHITRDQVRWVEPAHVWVDHAHAGLLLGWARPGTGWLARVVWVAPGAGEVTVDWLTQDRVQPRR